jgi:hypothetical protein
MGISLLCVKQKGSQKPFYHRSSIPHGLALRERWTNSNLRKSRLRPFSSQTHNPQFQASFSSSLPYIRRSNTDNLNMVSIESRVSKSTLPECYDSSGDAASCNESYDDHDMFGKCGEAEGSCQSFVEVDPRAEEKEVERLARRETTDVRVWRLVVVAAMVGAATLVSTGAYIILRKEEVNDFDKSVSIWKQKRSMNTYLSHVETHRLLPH